MKILPLTSFLLPLTFIALASCSSDDVLSYERVDAAHDAIVLRAGVNEGGIGVATRAIDDRHGKHVLFTEGTKLALQLNGQWTTTVTQSTTGTTGTESGSDTRHNNLTLSPALFWNDYGVADPDNTTGRAAGLTIYGAAVDGVTTDAPTVSAWDAISWGLPADQTTGWAAKDLLTSNNIRPTDAALDGSGRSGDGTYKFDDFMGTSHNTPSNIIEFTHAMAKVTVVLTAGEGFSEGKFEENPTVTLVDFKYTGSVNVPDKASTPTTDVTNIEMHRASGGANETSATFDALVYPGNTFTDATEILSLTADGNNFAITAKKINAAIQKAITKKATTGYPGTDNTFLQGWNYKILITVNKTSTHVTATIADWNEVMAEEEAPKINVIETYGHTGAAFTNDFDFFRSKTKASGYTDDAYVEHTEADGQHAYTFHNQLYWPDHQTHYFFRGVYPRVQTSSTEAGWIPAAKVSTSNVAVQNVAYQAGTYPSDLAFGWPKTAGDASDDETCKVAGHNSAAGICATEGNIYMNFQYAMSKVQVSLKSSGTVAAGNFVDLSHAVVEIVGGNSVGRLQFSDGKHDAFTAADKGNYTLHTTTAETGYTITTLDAIVPQTLSNDVKLRITVKDAGGNVLDVYEAQLNLIKDASSNLISEWKPGNYYKYQLDVLKTAIKVTATLKDWVPVEANENLWF